MTRSTVKKTLQTFHARDAMWEIFSKYAEEMECSVDYLINEAMRMYAANQGFTGQEGFPVTQVPSAHKDLASTIKDKHSSKLPHPADHTDSSSAPPVAPIPPGRPKPSTPPPPMPAHKTTAASPGRPILTLIFQGQKIIISQDQFIIGRGSKSADLPIRDSNISRKHAAIIFHNGTYYIKDLGSTNGIDYNGKPLDSKRIDEGDVFSICGFDLHFTYNA